VSRAAAPADGRPVARRRPTVGTGGAARAPRGTHPEVWRLVCAVASAREALPYSTAEARLLDGLRWWLSSAARGAAPGGAGGRLTPTGPAWAQALVLVSAVAAVAGPATRTLLAPWTVAVASAGAPAPSPTSAGGVDFRPFGV
jgi:hypothetical protein